MCFGFLRRRRRRRILAREHIEDDLWERALARVPMLERLGETELQRMRELVLVFVHEKKIEGAGGLEVTDEMRLVIALQACLPILELGLDAYRRFSSIFVYPSAYREKGSDDRSRRQGEAWYRGPIVLSWRDSAAGAALPNDSQNVVIHEFAHKLDMLDGAANGVPPLHAGQDPAAWQRDFQKAYDAFCRDAERGRKLPMDAYGATNPAEFLAVLTETFFENPRRIEKAWPEVYAHLVAFYRQDPLARSA